MSTVVSPSEPREYTHRYLSATSVDDRFDLANWSGPLVPVAADDPGVFVFAGGGTGGHLFPGIALSEAIGCRFPEARSIFVGSDRPIERRIVESHGVDHRPLPVVSWQAGKRRPDQFVWRNWQAFREARQLVRELRPSAVIGLGGFASAPLIWAAHREQVPVILLEQNAIPGRATCWLARLARVVCTAFAESVDWLPRHVPTLVCGNPVRQCIRDLWTEPLRETEERPHLLVLGGSQGADGLNMAVMDLVRRVPDLRNWTILHQSGPRQVSALRATYAEMGQAAVVEDFFEDMADVYRRASLVISRAGATTVAELACAGRPTILVPYPHATDNHQRANADAFARLGAAVVVDQAKASPQTAEGLARAINPLLSDARLRRKMARAAREAACPDAVDRILNLLHSEGASRRRSVCHR